MKFTPDLTNEELAAKIKNLHLPSKNPQFDDPNSLHLKWDPIPTIQSLKHGDTIRHKTTGGLYMVHGNYGDRVTAVDTVDVTNTAEWEVLFK